MSFPIRGGSRAGPGKGPGAGTQLQNVGQPPIFGSLFDDGGMPTFIR